MIPLIVMSLLGPVTPGPALAADDGGKIFTNACLACHTAKKQPLDKLRLSKEGWNEAITRMISYGAEIPKGKLPELLDYLVKSRVPASDASEIKK
ncbi:MAG: hypothetical protein NTY41_10675 [Proteobacteria bacterium]|nr:hypothetical protein [Pseudomonadota bacterium]